MEVVWSSRREVAMTRAVAERGKDETHSRDGKGRMHGMWALNRIVTTSSKDFLRYL